MNYVWTLLRLWIISILRSQRFWVMTAVFLLLTAGFAGVLPDTGRTSLEIGVTAEGERSERILQMLQQNDGYRFVRYQDSQKLERDILNGTLHCGYLLRDSDPPVTALSVDSSYMRPLLDEILLSAFYEAEMPQFAADYLERSGFSGADAQADFQRLRKEAVPMAIQIRQTGVQEIETLASSSVQPLLYALLVSSFLAACLLSALLQEEGQERAIRQIAAASGHPAATRLVQGLAQILLNLFVLLAGDFLLNWILVAPAYQWYARWCVFLLLAALAALLAAGVSAFRRGGMAAASVLPVFLVVSIFCSGAFVNPEALPAGLGALRFLSPAWYALRLMALF